MNSRVGVTPREGSSGTLATYEGIRRLVGQTGEVEMPDELKTRLRRFLLEQLG